MDETYASVMAAKMVASGSAHICATVLLALVYGDDTALSIVEWRSGTRKRAQDMVVRSIGRLLDGLTEGSREGGRVEVQGEIDGVGSVLVGVDCLVR